IPTVGIVALAILSGVGLAGVPCTGTSTVSYTETSPPCISSAPLCPSGDRDTLKLVATVLDCYGTALVGKTVEIRPIIGSGGFFFKVPAETLVLDTTDASGVVSHNYMKVGGCGTISFSVICAGVELGPTASFYISNFDQNIPPDGVVNAIDFGIFGGFGHFGSTTYPCGDYNCDGVENAIDFAIFGSHFGD
ncbi:MAG: hypothetical protein WAW06_05290, partial [bacterium]